jgi:hypothetical protein
MAWHPFTISSTPGENCAAFNESSIRKDSKLALALTFAKSFTDSYILYSYCLGEDLTTHHIKCHGPEQWTGRLLFLARTLSNQGQGPSRSDLLRSGLVVNIDGPYGLPLKVANYR